VVTHTGAAVIGLAVRRTVMAEQSRGTEVAHQNDAAAVATVAAVRARERLELFAFDRDTAVAAPTRTKVQCHLVNKRCHGKLLWIGWYDVRYLLTFLAGSAGNQENAAGPQTAEASRSSPLLVKKKLCCCDDVDDLTAALCTELDSASGKCEQRVIAATADVDAGVEVSAALTNDDLAGLDDLATEALDAQVLGVGIAAVT
jgi:hypothetical protein